MHTRRSRRAAICMLHRVACGTYRLGQSRFAAVPRRNWAQYWRAEIVEKGRVGKRRKVASAGSCNSLQCRSVIARACATINAVTKAPEFRSYLPDHSVEIVKSIAAARGALDGAFTHDSLEESQSTLTEVITARGLQGAIGGDKGPDTVWTVIQKNSEKSSRALREVRVVSGDRGRDQKITERKKSTMNRAGEELRSARCLRREVSLHEIVVVRVAEELAAVERLRGVQRRAQGFQSGTLPHRFHPWHMRSGRNGECSADEAISFKISVQRRVGNACRRNLRQIWPIIATERRLNGSSLYVSATNPKSAAGRRAEPVGNTFVAVRWTLGSMDDLDLLATLACAAQNIPSHTALDPRHSDLTFSQASFTAYGSDSDNNYVHNNTQNSDFHDGSSGFDHSAYNMGYMPLYSLNSGSDYPSSSPSTPTGYK
ncbi:hypothetical protein C8R43DRAFT_1211188 [Mycena crocata]|nr:hypothetical protein C8R43DRAFT_1211188 [Mycena crocata]